MFNLLKDKRARTIGIIGFIFIALFLSFLIIIYSPSIQAGKSDQYYDANYTCENITENVQWEVIAPGKDGATNYYNWTPEDCPGNKDCDMYSLHMYVRFLNAGKDNAAAGMSYGKIANTTETDIPLNQLFLPL